VAPPMIAMSRQQGPWPKCVGMNADICVEYIESSTSDSRDSLDLVIVPRGTRLTRDFRKDRVRIFVDDENVVASIPGRG
jgi:hypothetical protein